jgi:hypothetical protein
LQINYVNLRSQRRFEKPEVKGDLKIPVLGLEKSKGSNRPSISNGEGDIYKDISLSKINTSVDIWLKEYKKKVKSSSSSSSSDENKKKEERGD